MLDDPTVNTDIENREYYRVAEETGNYASITSGFMAQYMSNMNCDLTTIDVDLKDYGYGIALPKGVLQIMYRINHFWPFRISLQEAPEFGNFETP